MTDRSSREGRLGGDVRPKKPDNPRAGDGDSNEGDIADDANRSDAAEPRPIAPDRLRGPRP